MQGALLAEELRVQRAVGVPLDRDDRLPEQVAAHHRGVSLVELGRTEELAPEEIGAVDVGGVEEPDRPVPFVTLSEAETHQPVSSGSSYHCIRSPTRARIFHFIDFGSASMRLRRSSRRAVTMARSMLKVTVRQSPQSAAHSCAT